MIEQFRRLGPKFGVRLDHHSYEVFEFFVSLSYEMDGYILQVEIAFEDILFAFESVTKGMLASRKYVIEDTSQAEDINFLRFMRIFEFVVTLIEDNLTRLPSDATFDSLCVIGVHLRIKLLRKAHIRQFDAHELVYKDVIRFDVPVNNVVVV